jgi:hypothetical protein
MQSVDKGLKIFMLFINLLPYLSFLFIVLVDLNHNSVPCLLELQMLKKLTKQLNGEDWSWNNLNTLCWAIGSISGSMVEEQVCTLLLC